MHHQLKRLAALAAGTAVVVSGLVTVTAVDAAAATPALSSAQAVQIALARVPGATAADIVKIKLERDDGRYEWDGELRYNGYEYEFEIDAQTGRVRDWERERSRASQPAPSPTTPPATPVTAISQAQALQIAYARAGVAVADRTKKIKLEREKGRLVWEGEFISGRYEYEFEIDATSGRIIDWERERA
ncbi:MAG: PepSY domain-containing protein [Propionibacteriaceae bacterium]|jgi:uncharacterized membrane protein YkoI|nr:PepSY domain-containing protein [Propionibacteriaceae bacterium]